MPEVSCSCGVLTSDYSDFVIPGVVTPQFKSQHSEAPARASYGSTSGQNGYPVQVGAPPSLAQLQRHMMGGRDKQEKDVEAGGGTEEESQVRKSESNNTLSSRNLELHDSEVTPDTSPGLDLDQTTMIGSALDLDSLDGDRGSEVGQVSHNTNSHSQSQSGSQIGLLKLSAV